jgi:hypothetical protein
MVEAFPSNSNTVKSGGEEPKTTRPTVDKVVINDVSKRKAPLGKRLAETFLGGDAKTVANYVVFDVLIPAAKDMFSDAVSQGFDRMLWGDSARSGRRGGGRPVGDAGHVSYNRMSGSRTREREDPRRQNRQVREAHNFDDILLATRHEADTVLERMSDLVNQYDVCTIADLYSLVGITPTFTDNNWGWTELIGSRAVRDGGGYLLDLPRPKPVE